MLIRVLAELRRRRRPCRAFGEPAGIARQGHASLVRFGVASTLDAAFTAHAWVESDGVVLLSGDVSAFSELRRIQPRLP